MDPNLPMGYPSGWEWIAAFHWEPDYVDVVTDAFHEGWKPHELDLDLCSNMFDHRVEA